MATPSCNIGDVDLAVAVAIEDGLVTPVIRAAQNKSLREISEAVKDLAHRARNKRMKPEEFQGGTLTVSNLGSYGIDYFSAIINPPQGFILADRRDREKAGGRRLRSDRASASG